MALSSRNAYLSVEERTASTALYKSLCAFQTAFEAGERDIATLSGITKVYSSFGITIEIAHYVV